MTIITMCRVEQGVVTKALRFDTEKPNSAARLASLGSEWVDSTGTKAGKEWLYDGNVFTKPVAQPSAPVPNRMVISEREFINLIGKARLRQLQAAIDGGDDDLLMFREIVKAERELDLENTDIIAGLDAMVAAGIVTNAQKNNFLQGVAG